jgi:DNA mismatch endonuclease, patch repair protein
MIIGLFDINALQWHTILVVYAVFVDDKGRFWQISCSVDDMDRLTPEKRSWLMSRVRSTNTKPEMTVRSALHRLGYRYALHRRDLPGNPDLVFAARGKIIFVHGCFWHGHSCRAGRAQSKSNVAFWENKIETNVRRDRRNIAKLRRDGWGVKIVWECKIKKNNWLASTLRFLEKD